ncbi:uncharacterized protein LOC134277887 [Saccostrea cucullata]|uniref:uncharacterized protein LOC134277887 n=1 Tax=Saccostrea cuccullata TaxID=36930 RepID=UPI002ED4C0D4
MLFRSFFLNIFLTVARTHNYFTECKRCHEEGTERCERLNVTGFEFSSRCICIYGYVGLYCQHYGCRHDETCFNNGTCDASDINTDGICRCPPKWSGSKCQYGIYRFGWDIDTEKDFVKTGNITFHPDGQDGTVHHGRIIRGEKFELTIYGIGKRYDSKTSITKINFNLTKGKKCLMDS